LSVDQRVARRDPTGGVATKVDTLAERRRARNVAAREWARASEVENQRCDLARDPREPMLEWDASARRFSREVRRMTAQSMLIGQR
jgi:hypothetical protein